MASWACGLACMTALSTTVVEDWLEENCDGDWTVRLADFEGPLGSGKKKIEVLFEQREDMDVFKAKFKDFEAQKLKDVGSSVVPESE